MPLVAKRPLPLGITCEKWEPVAEGSRKCRFYSPEEVDKEGRRTPGMCTLPDEFVCVEWKKIADLRQISTSPPVSVPLPPPQPVAPEQVEFADLLSFEIDEEKELQNRSDTEKAQRSADYKARKAAQASEAMQLNRARRKFWTEADADRVREGDKNIYEIIVVGGPTGSVRPEAPLQRSFGDERTLRNALFECREWRKREKIFKKKDRVGLYIRDTQRTLEVDADFLLRREDEKIKNSESAVTTREQSLNDIFGDLRQIMERVRNREVFLEIKGRTTRIVPVPTDKSGDEMTWDELILLMSIQRYLGGSLIWSSEGEESEASNG